jgi:hypothetical protein
MSWMRRPAIVFVLGMAPVLALGCGSNKPAVDPEVQRRKSELAEIYDSYMQARKGNNGRPPKQLTDLKPFSGIYPMGYQALQKGDYVAVWSVSASDSTTVLAYEKDAPKQGGAVLMADGSVKNMTADELQTALKHKG